MAACRALVPKMHLSDMGAEHGKKKFKVGQEVMGRVLECDVSARRIQLTLKKSLVASKLPVLTSVKVRSANKSDYELVLCRLNNPFEQCVIQAMRDSSDAC